MNVNYLLTMFVHRLLFRIKNLFRMFGESLVYYFPCLKIFFGVKKVEPSDSSSKPEDTVTLQIVDKFKPILETIKEEEKKIYVAYLAEDGSIVCTCGSTICSIKKQNDEQFKKNLEKTLIKPLYYNKMRNELLLKKTLKELLSRKYHKILLLNQINSTIPMYPSNKQWISNNLEGCTTCGTIGHKNNDCIITVPATPLPTNPQDIIQSPISSQSSSSIEIIKSVSSMDTVYDNNIEIIRSDTTTPDAIYSLRNLNDVPKIVESESSSDNEEDGYFIVKEF